MPPAAGSQASAPDSELERAQESQLNQNSQPTQSSQPQPLKADYYLKAMVMARILAEATALSIMVLAPIVLMLMGKFWGFTPVLKFLFAGVALVAVCILPIYGFIPYRVSLRGAKITSHALFSSPSTYLQNISAVNRRSTLNWVRYVAIFDGGEINIPVWLKDVDKLIALIKSQFPQYIRQLSAPRGRTFKCDPLAIVMQFAQVLLSLIFIVVCWGFTTAVHRKDDLFLVYGFALVVTLLLLYRAYIVLTMPKAIKVEQSTIEVQTVFFKRVIECNKVKAVKPSIPLLPEGQMLETQAGSYLIGNSMDEADDLVTALKEMAAAFNKRPG